MEQKDGGGHPAVVGTWYGVRSGSVEKIYLKGSEYNGGKISMSIPKGGVKSGRQYWETVYLMPLRYGLANRKEEHDYIPTTGPESKKEGLQPLPHWRYACSFVRSGWK